MNHRMIAGLAAVLATFSAGQAQANDGRVTLGAVAGSTGVEADVAWRFHERLGVSARYTDGLDWSTCTTPQTQDGPVIAEPSCCQSGSVYRAITALCLPDLRYDPQQ